MKIKLRNIKQGLIEAVLAVYTVYTEKGISPLRLPLLIAAAAVFMLYMAVYSPLVVKIAKERKAINSLAASSKYASVFEDYRSKLSAYERKLPALRDKDKWLFDVVMSASQKVGVRPDSVSQQQETEIDNFILASRDVGAVVTFKSLAELLGRIESSPFYLKISQLAVRKEPSKLGMVTVQFQVSTVFMKAYSAKAAQ